MLFTGPLHLLMKTGLTLARLPNFSFRTSQTPSCLILTLSKVLVQSNNSSQKAPYYGHNFSFPLQYSWTPSWKNAAISSNFCLWVLFFDKIFITSFIQTVA